MKVHSVQKIRILVAVALLASAGAAGAEWYDVPAIYSSGMLDAQINYNIGMQIVNSNPTYESSSPGNPQNKSYSTVATTAVGISKWPKKLAASYPQAQRKNARQTFGFALKTYRKLEKQLKIPKNDVAGALAAYVAGNYMAYYDVDLDQAFMPLVEQMRSMLIKIPEFNKARKSVKRDYYEVMAIGGTFMAMARAEIKKQANQAYTDNLRTAAKINLETFLGVSIYDVVINDDGLKIGQ
jgi:hypothetical protein